MSEPIRHHYIPIFYTKPWANERGNLCEYSRPYRDVKTKWRNPSATGYEDNLYSKAGVPADQGQTVEKHLMGSTDNLASKAHPVLLSWGSSGVQDLTPAERFGWARFLYSLFVRTPEAIEMLREQIVKDRPEFIESHRSRYEAIRRPDDPQAFDEFKALYLANPATVDPMSFLPGILHSKDTLRSIYDLRFHTLTFPASGDLKFLTSDRPLTNALAQRDAYISLPISPTALFLAVRDDDTYRRVLAAGREKVVAAVNRAVCSQARRYVYGADATQLQFVEDHLGREEAASSQR